MIGMIAPSIIEVVVAVIVFIVAVGVHELGHILPCWWYEWDWKMCYRWYGVGIHTDDSVKTRRQQFILAASGPALSILFGFWILAFPHSDTWVHFLLAVTSWECAILQLIPFRGITDGSKMLAALRTPNR